MLKRILATVVASCVLVPALAAQSSTPKKHRVKVRKGVYLKFETVQPLSSATAAIGDAVPLRLARPLVVDGAVLLPEGAMFQGLISKVKRAGPNCQNGDLEFGLDHIRFADGTVARSKYEPNFSGSFGWVPEYVPNQSAGGWDDVKSAIGMAPLVPVVLFAAAVHPHEGGSHHGGAIQCTAPGKEDVLPTGTTIAVWITKDHHVHVAR
jgi:hypothetical protein